MYAGHDPLDMGCAGAVARVRSWCGRGSDQRPLVGLPAVAAAPEAFGRRGQWPLLPVLVVVVAARMLPRGQRQ